MSVYQSHVGAPDYIGAAQRTPVLDLAGSIQAGMRLANEMTIAQQTIQQNDESMRMNAVLTPLKIQEAQAKVNLANEEMRVHQLTNTADAIEAQKNVRMAEDNAKVKALNDKAELAAHIGEISDLNTLAGTNPAAYLAKRQGMISVLGNNVEFRTNILPELDAKLDDSDVKTIDGKVEKGSYLRSLFENGGDISSYSGTSGMSSRDIAELSYTAGKQARKNALLAAGGTEEQFRIQEGLRKQELDLGYLKMTKAADIASRTLSFEKEMAQKPISDKVTLPGEPLPVANFGNIADQDFRKAVGSMLKTFDADLGTMINKELTGEGVGADITLLNRQREQNAQLANLLTSWQPGPLARLENLIDFGSTGADQLEQIRPIYDMFREGRKTGDPAITKTALKQLESWLWTRASSMTVDKQRGLSLANQMNAVSRIDNAMGMVSSALGSAPADIPTFNTVADMEKSGLPVETPVIVGGVRGKKGK